MPAMPSESHSKPTSCTKPLKPCAGSIIPNSDGDSHSTAGDSAHADINTTLRRRL